MLDKNKILDIFNELNLPKDKYALGTSGSLVLFGIKEYANDLDIDCYCDLYDEFLEKGHKESYYEPKKGYYARIIDLTDEIQLIRKDGLNSSEIVEIEGVSVFNLETVRRFKKFLGREKDKKDIELIDRYLEGMSNGRVKEEIG